MGIVAFLTAQYDREQQLAEAATPGPWRYNPTKRHHIVGTSLFEEAVFAGPAGADAVCVAGTGDEDDEDDEQSMRDAAFIAYWDPARVLADLTAKRELLALWQEIQSGVYSPDANRLAEDMLEQLLAPYGKRAVWNSDTGYQIDE